MEVPYLSVSSIWNLKSKVSVVYQINISVSFHFRNDIEWSLDIEAEFFIELSFSWFSLPFIGINDIPLLMELIVVLIGNDDVSVFNINIALNF
jgi:hypothetical protein